MQSLSETLDRRRRPEDVAEMLLEILGAALTPEERRVLDRAAAGSIRRGVTQFTSMLEDFARPIPPERQVRKAAELFQTARAPTAAECADAGKVEQFIRDLGPEIRKAFGRSDFKRDRLNRERREESGLGISGRRYNKLFRHLARLERKLSTYAREQRKYEFTRIGKSSLATKLTCEEFSRDLNTACFIAYFVSRSNLRSQFTISGQERPTTRLPRCSLTAATRKLVGRRSRLSGPFRPLAARRRAEGATSRDVAHGAPGYRGAAAPGLGEVRHQPADGDSSPRQ